MPMPKKYIPSIIINSFKSCYADGMGCGACGAITTNSCYRCSSNPDICACEATEPSRSKCRGGWIKQPPPTTTEMQMMTDIQMLADPPQSWPQSCEGQCWERYNRGEMETLGNGHIRTVYDSNRVRGIRDRCLATCRQIARDGVYEM